MKEKRCPMCHQLVVLPSEPGDTVALDILGQIADAHGVRIAEMIGPSQAAMFVQARYAAMAALQEAGYVQKEIARILRRDRSTISVAMNVGKRVHRKASA